MKNLHNVQRKGWVSLALAVMTVIISVGIPTKELHASGYNYQQAVAYAETWGGKKRNPEYLSHSADCMNFVSQCLYAGGLTTGSDWQPYNSAWNCVTPFVRIMRERGYQVIENPTADQIYPGNPVIYHWKNEPYDWSHATICVGYDSNGTPIVNGHTRDVSHRNWNYAAGGADKMCTILINDGSTQLGNPVDMGDSFFAYINSSLANKVLTNDGDNVSIRSKGSSDEEIRSQVWKFVRQEDGSYVIYSAKDDTKVLDVDGAGTVSGTNVQVFVYWGHPAQHWYIYEVDGDYQLKSQCSECLLDVANSGKTEGTNIQMCKSNGYMAQRFQIEKVNTPGITRVYCTPGTGSRPTTLSWDATTDTTVYNVRINGTYQKDIWNLTSTSCQVELPAGNYEVYVNACNAFSYSTSPTISFTVQNEIGADSVDVDRTEGAVTDPVDTDRAEGAVTDPVNTDRVEETVIVPTDNDGSGEPVVEPSKDDTEETQKENATSIIWNHIDNRVTTQTTTNIWNYIFGTEVSESAECNTLPAETNVGTEAVPTYEVQDEDLSAADDISDIQENNTTVSVVNHETEEIEKDNEASLSIEDNGINDMESFHEESGIRLVELRDNNGILQGIFLKIVYPYNGENQVLTIRLI